MCLVPSLHCCCAAHSQRPASPPPSPPLHHAWLTPPPAGWVIVHLLDGRYFIGILRTFDHFCAWPLPAPPSPPGRIFKRASPPPSPFSPCLAGNIVLENARERKFAPGIFCDIPVGLYILRGESMMLIAEFVSCPPLARLPPVSCAPPVLCACIVGSCV